MKAAQVDARRTELVFRQLCHQLSLDRTGKVRGAVDSLVLAMLAIDSPLGDGDATTVASSISQYFGLGLPTEAVKDAIDRHVRSGRVLVVPIGKQIRLELSEDCRAELETRIAASQELEANVRAEWLESVGAESPHLPPDVLWIALQTYLGTAFRQHGAETVELLTGDQAQSVSNAGLSGLLDQAVRSAGLESETQSAKAAIASFFTAQSLARRRYLSELLDGTFTFMALTAGDATADYLRGQLPTTKLFIDTNAILALLGLPGNPMSAATVELVEFIQQNGFPFKLYYHERTLKELQDLISASAEKLRARRQTQALSGAVMSPAVGHLQMTGLERHFHQQNAQRPIDVEVFLSKFDHVTEILDGKGLKIYRQSGPEFDVEAKGRLIAEFEHFATVRRPERPRNYMALDHDVVLWMSLQRQRRAGASPLRAGALLLTNDLLLFSFDRSYLAGQDQAGPTVLLPQHLLQLLRPLARSAGDLDQRFLDVFAAPEFRTAQSQYGAASQKVMSYLATYEDVPTETAVRILGDEVLLGRLEKVEAEDEEFRNLIEGAVFEENGKLQNQLAEERARSTADLDRAQFNAAEERKRLAQEIRQAMDRSLEESKAAAEARRRLETFRSEADTNLTSVLNRQAELEGELEQQRELTRSVAARLAVKEESSRRRRRGAIRWFASLAILLLGLFFVWRGPLLLNWDSLEKLENRTQLQVLASLVVGALAYIPIRPSHWWQAISVVVLSAVITMVSLF